MRRLLAAFLFSAGLHITSPPSASAQLQADTLFTWRGYAHESTCRVRLYRSAPDENKPYTIVLQELAANRGRSTFDDARHIVELISRERKIDPEEAYWIFHWGGFSYVSSHDSGKEIFFRATFRRTDAGAVGTPFWRLVNRAAVEAYTDRAFR